MKKKIFALILLIITTMSVLFFGKSTCRISADTGPKPAAYVTFSNLPEDNMEIGFLLKDEYSTSHTGTSLDDIGITEKEGYQYRYIITSTKRNASAKISWTYFCPSEFKIYLYNSSTSDFYETELITRYAFESFYDIDYSQINQETGIIFIKDQKASYYAKNIGIFLLRLVICLATELLIALAFRFTWKSYITIGVTNIITQVLLNLFCNAFFANAGQGWILIMTPFILVPGEILVFLIEWLVYRKLTWNKDGTRGKKALLYSACANGASLILGFILWMFI